MTAKTSAAITIGNHPPSTIFKRLAERKVRSTSPKKAEQRDRYGEPPALVAHVNEGEPGGDAIIPLTAMP